MSDGLVSPYSTYRIPTGDYEGYLALLGVASAKNTPASKSWRTGLTVANRLLRSGRARATFRIKNDVDYDRHRKFTADSSLTFTAPGEKPKK